MFGKKKDSKKKEEVVEEAKVEATPENEVVEEAKVEATPDDENNGEGVSTETAKAKKTKGGKVKFKRSCHQKMYDKVDPNGRAAEVLVKRFGL